MLGVYDFCGHYEWTFEWLRQQGGEPLLRQYWDEAIHQDSQRHAADLILQKGIKGMQEYFSRAFHEEVAGYHTTTTENVFRIDMHHCPSKGFLIRNGLEQYRDYCDHCMGWIGPLMKRGKFVVDHQHNHHGQCWWEFRQESDSMGASEPSQLAGSQDVRLSGDWKHPGQRMDTYERANQPDDKSSKG